MLIREDKLHDAQVQPQNAPGDKVIQMHERESAREFKEVTCAFEAFYKQKSKQTWLKMGDNNTKFFHSSRKARRNKVRINSIHNDERQEVKADNDIGHVFVEYFQSILGSSSPRKQKADARVFNMGKKLDIGLQLSLVKPVTELEIKKVVFAMDENKSPGPDGYGSGFFKASWHIIGGDVTDAVIEFFKSGKFLKQLNAIVISVIPKTDSPIKASDFILYKVISKLLCNRLSSVLPDLISHN